VGDLSASAKRRDGIGEPSIALGFDLDHQLPRRHVRNDNDRHWIFVFGDAGRRSRVTKIVKPIVRCAINPNLKRTLDEL
jgi:hypothetical protein